MKALFISNDPFIFDEGSAVRKRLAAYAGAIGQLHVISRAPRSAATVSEGSLTLHPIYGSKLGSRIAIVRLARSLVREQGIDIVSAQDPFEYGLAALIATSGTSARLYVQIHTDIYSPYFATTLKDRIRRLIAAVTLRAADGIRVVSTRIKDSLVKRYRKLAPISVIPIPVPPLPPAILLPANPFMFTLITAARLEPEKRIDTLLAALLLVRRKYPSVGLYVIGDGSLRQKLTQQAERTGLAENVIFLGYRSDAVGLIESAQAFVQASAYEGYGLTLVEAALAGIPTVTTDVGIIGDVLLPERDVLTASVGGAHAFAAQVIRLIESAELRSSLGRNAKSAAEAHIREHEDQPDEIAADLARTCGVANTRRP